MTGCIALSPIDILHIRGNRLFADSGAGDAVMPPWPSLFSGAIRSRILVDQGAIEQFSRGQAEGAVAEVVGRSVSDLGSFRVAAALLRRKTDVGETLLVPAPADLVVLEGDQGEPEPSRLTPVAVSGLGVSGSFAFEESFVLRRSKPGKPRSGYHLTLEGFAKYQRGRPIDASDLVPAQALWKLDSRLGIGLDPGKRTAREGLIYTSETVALCAGVDFVVRIEGGGSLVPQDGMVRLGGDGRGASVTPWEPAGRQLPWDFLPGGSRFAMILATPGIFPGGSTPPGVHDGRLRVGGLELALKGAVIAGYGVVSGWDLALGRPKPAERVVPAGSVFLFERVSGDSAELRTLLEEGLWPLIRPQEEEKVDAARRAEGFNNVWFADLPEGSEESDG